MSLMSLSTNPSLLPYASKPPAAPASSAPNESLTLAMNAETADRVLNSAAVQKILSDGVKKGDTVTILGNEGEIVTVSKSGPSTFDNLKKTAGDLARATATEASNVIAQDPAFAFKTAAFAVQSQVFAGVPSQFTAVAGQAFVPMVRVVSIALDLKKANDTWKSERASGLDKCVVGGHLVTDIVGIGGAIAKAVPALGPAVSMVLSAVGLVGDIASYGYHVVKYFQDRPKHSEPPALQAAKEAQPQQA